MMQIAKNKVATFEYAVRDDHGQVIDNSRDSGPLSYIHGSGAIVPGLECALENRWPDDMFSVTVEPAQGYGEWDESLLHVFSREELAELGNLHVGMQLQAEDDSGTHLLRVHQIDAKSVTLDENHPLAGKTLTFDIHVLAVRDATEEELERGQAYDVACREDCHSCSSQVTPDCGCGHHHH